MWRPVVAVALSLLATGGTIAAARTDVTAASARSHVFVLVMENKSRAQVMRSPDTRYFQRLARRGGQAINSYAVGHPSLPNYIALISGSTQGIAKDCLTCSANGRNLGDQLARTGRSWRAYLQGLPAPCARPGRDEYYTPLVDPFAHDRSITADPARCRDRQPFSHLLRDIKSHRLPDFGLIAPDLCNDTHSCPTATGDRFLAGLVPRLLPALGPQGFLVITYDEGSHSERCCGGSDGGHIATIVLGPTVRSGARMTTPIDHYGLLASIEDAFGVGHLGAARDPRHGSLAALFDGGTMPRMS